jgi:hypothetical protein
MVFENKVLMRIFESKRQKVTGENYELHSSQAYSSPDIVVVFHFTN